MKIKPKPVYSTKPNPIRLYCTFCGESVRFPTHGGEVTCKCRVNYSYRPNVGRVSRGILRRWLLTGVWK